MIHFRVDSIDIFMILFFFTIIILGSTVITNYFKYKKQSKDDYPLSKNEIDEGWIIYRGTKIRRPKKEIGNDTKV
jgi:hypothetical protein